MTRKTYVARCERDGNWWVVEVEGLRGGVTQAKRLDQVEAVVREVVGLLRNVPEDSVDVRVEPILGGDLSPEVTSVLQLREEANAIQERASSAMQAAVSGLAARHLSLRDIGTILGISHQRAAQLLTATQRGRHSAGGKPKARNRRLARV